MKQVRITVVAIANHQELIDRYELPLENPCSMQVGTVFHSENAAKPNGLCEVAWETLKPFVSDLANGKGHFYGEWMKNPYSAMVSCNDGFRPVSFLLEAVE